MYMGIDHANIVAQNSRRGKFRVYRRYTCLTLLLSKREEYGERLHFFDPDSDSDPDPEEI